MDIDELTRQNQELNARIQALERAVQHLNLVLAGELNLPHQAYPGWLNIVVERARHHRAMPPDVLEALQRFADQLSAIPEDFPEFLKQLRRDYPPGQSDKPAEG